MENLCYSFSAPLTVWHGKGAWFFMTLPKMAADEIRFFNPSAKGFIPISVTAKIGATEWKTSIFPDNKSGSYLIAIKKDVRKAEGLGDGDVVEIQVKIQT